MHHRRIPKVSIFALGSRKMLPKYHLYSHLFRTSSPFNDGIRDPHTQIVGTQDSRDLKRIAQKNSHDHSLLFSRWESRKMADKSCPELALRGTTEISARCTSESSHHLRAVERRGTDAIMQSGSCGMMRSLDECIIVECAVLSAQSIRTLYKMQEFT